MFFAKLIPAHVIATLYTRGSLQKDGAGLQLRLKNRLLHARILKINAISMNEEPVDIERVLLSLDNTAYHKASEIGVKTPLDFPLRQHLHVKLPDVDPGLPEYGFTVVLDTQPFGKITLQFTDKPKPADKPERENKIPRNEQNDYTPIIIEQRLEFAEKHSGVALSQLREPNLKPEVFRGNCEQYIGTAQVPIGLAGPIRINGEWAKGEFLVPLATTEGTLVASYNRGIKMLNSCGGVITTVCEDLMQRAPVFTFNNARQALSFKAWVEEHLFELQELAKASSAYARLVKVEGFLSNNFTFLRFNYRTGDAAGQNMVTKATYEACLWLMEHCPYKPQRFYLESNMATDKKPSFLNSLLGRGKKVTAEITLRKEVLEQELGVSARQLEYHRAVGNIGAFLSGTNNNGLHSVNAIAALFIATGQDVANVAESSACITHAEVQENGDLYASITLPSLIVASYGGGTGLPTQRECLELMDCYGEGKAKKLAEIVAGVVAAGELSLAAAISAADWVNSHEDYGRNR